MPTHISCYLSDENDIAMQIVDACETLDEIARQPGVKMQDYDIRIGTWLLERDAQLCNVLISPNAKRYVLSYVGQSTFDPSIDPSNYATIAKVTARIIIHGE